jgi:hypothetical protein
MRAKVWNDSEVKTACLSGNDLRSLRRASIMKMTDWPVDDDEVTASRGSNRYGADSLWRAAPVEKEGGWWVLILV